MNDNEIKAALAEYAKSRPRYMAFAGAARTLLSQLLEAEGIEPETVDARAKEADSLAKKLTRHSYKSLADIADLCGVRIVLQYRADAEKVRDLVRREFSIVEEVEHGSAGVESFGYRSHHFVVRLSESRTELREWRAFSNLRLELQVRTILEHAWATISHKLDYKSPAQVPAAVRRQLFRVAALLETSDELFDDFRAGVERVREGYAVEVERDEWRDLPLDLEAIGASWQSMNFSGAREAAVAAGWTDPDEDYQATAPKDDVGWFTYLHPIAVRAGIATIGELAAAVDTASGRVDDLRFIADYAEREGHKPYAHSVDVVTTLLLADHPELIDESPFVDELTDAIRELSKRQEGG